MRILLKGVPNLALMETVTSTRLADEVQKQVAKLRESGEREVFFFFFFGDFFLYLIFFILFFSFLFFSFVLFSFQKKGKTSYFCSSEHKWRGHQGRYSP